MNGKKIPTFLDVINASGTSNVCIGEPSAVIKLVYNNISKIKDLYTGLDTTYKGVYFVGTYKDDGFYENGDDEKLFRIYPTPIYCYWRFSHFISQEEIIIPLIGGVNYTPIVQSVNIDGNIHSYHISLSYNIATDYFTYITTNEIGQVSYDDYYYNDGGNLYLEFGIKNWCIAM